MTEISRNISLLLSEDVNEEDICNAKEYLADSIEEAYKNPLFFSLNTKDILDIISKCTFEELNIVKELVMKMEENKADESPLILKVIDYDSEEIDDYISIISKLGSCPVCRHIKYLNDYNSHLVEPDYEGIIKDLRNQIRVLVKQCHPETLENEEIAKKHKAITILKDSIDSYQTIDIKSSLIGCNNVGRTIIAMKLDELHFPHRDSLSRIGAGFFPINFMKDNYEVNMMVWDVPAEGKYSNLSKLHLRDSSIYFFVFDIANYKSFEFLEIYYEKNKDIIPDNSLFIVIGNKQHSSEERTVSTEKAEEWAEQVEGIYIEVSTETGVGFSNLEKIIQDSIILKDAVSSNENLAPEEKDNCNIF